MDTCNVAPNSWTVKTPIAGTNFFASNNRHQIYGNRYQSFVTAPSKPTFISAAFRILVEHNTNLWPHDKQASTGDTN